MQWKRPKVVALVALATYGVIAGLLAWLKPAHVEFSSATEVRSWSTYSGYMAPPLATSHAEIAHEHTRLEEQASLSATPYILRYGPSIDPDNGFPPIDHLIEAGPDGVAHLPNGETVWIQGGAIVYHDVSGGPADGIDWRDLEGQPLKAFPMADDMRYPWPSGVQKPNGAIAFQTEGFEFRPHWLRMTVFDARTLVALNDESYPKPYGHESFTIAELALWHRGPLVVAIDFAAGDDQRQTVAFRKDEVIRFSDTEVQILDVINRMSSPHIRRGSGGTVHIGFKPSNGFSAILSASPHSHSRLISVLNPIVAKSRPDTLEPVPWPFIQFEPPPNSTDIWTTPDEVTICYRPTVYRVLFQLEHFPGLPESIVDVDNLFEAHIPAYSLSTRGESLQLLGRMVQMQASHAPSPFSPPTFSASAPPVPSTGPYIGENTTPQSLLNQLRKDAKVTVDPLAHTILLESKEPWWSFWKRFWP